MKLQETCKLFTDGDWIESKDQAPQGIRLVQTGNIGEGEYLNKEGKEKYISEETFKALNCTEVLPGDVLISRLPDPVGRGCIIPQSGEKMITAVDCTICRVDEDIINKEYLCYYLQSNCYYQQLDQSVTGTTRKRISRKNLGNVEINIPTLSEQQTVVAKLNKLTNVIRNKNTQLRLHNELIKARFVEMFGDPVSNPLGWKKERLVDVCTKLNDGTHFSPESFETGDYKYITAKNIKLDGFDFSTITYVPESIHRPIYERCNPERGDVLYIKDGVTTGIAMVNTLEEEFTLLSSVALLKQNRDIINGHFLCGVLNNQEMYRDIRSNMGGAAITRLTIAKLREIKVIVPPLELQDEFASFVCQIDKSKVAIQKSLDETQLLFESLMQQYFG